MSFASVHSLSWHVAVRNQLGDDIEGIGAQLRELLVLEAQTQQPLRQ